MEFRAPTEAKEQNARAFNYLTNNLSNPEKGRNFLAKLTSELGNAVENYPDWHPILTIPTLGKNHIYSLSSVELYKGIDHTVQFVRGFITCPYSEAKADEMVSKINNCKGLIAYRSSEPLYSDAAYPVIVIAKQVVLDADGTIKSKDALRWFLEKTLNYAKNSEVAETWWNMQDSILGKPYGARSSLFVNQHTGGHMRKILEALNASGMFGPIIETSLKMLSQKKRDKITDNLIRSALNSWDKSCKRFTFELCGETCNAEINDTWNDGQELSVRVRIGDNDLYVSGHYYAENDNIDGLEPTGKRVLAEKFL